MRATTNTPTRARFGSVEHRPIQPLPQPEANGSKPLPLPLRSQQPQQREYRPGERLKRQARKFAARSRAESTRDYEALIAAAIAMSDHGR